jgi:crotonobetaine/carnitine-CoA ligase
MERITLGELVRQKAKKNSRKIFLSFQDRQFSYEEMDRQSRRFAQAFRSLGIGRGDHVALILPNEPEYLFCWFGLAMLGAVTITVNHQLRGESLQYVLREADSQMVILAPEFLPSYEAMGAGLSGIPSFALQPLDKPPETPVGIDSLNRFIPEEASDFRPDGSLKDIDPLIITFTSGTTGLPKLVENGHRAYIASARDLAEYAEMKPQDRIYSHLPLYHANPQVYCVLAALLADACVILAPRFSASRFWEDIRRYGATAFSYVGAVLPILLAQPERPDEKEHPAKKCFGGGAPKDVYDEFTRRFGVEVLELYGMSESGVWNTINRPGKGRSGTVGTIRRGFSIQIVDEEDNPLPPGTIGEIVIRPEVPFLMFHGYYKNPEETLRCSRNWWFHTGDLGKVDAEGYYTFCGRKKETIRRAGENIPPGEIERVIARHPAIRECAAVGIPDPIMEEEIKVVAVLKAGQEISPQALFEFAREKLPRFMMPRYIEFVEALPKSASEKIQRTVLKKQGLTDRTWDAKGQKGQDGTPQPREGGT